MVNAEWKNASDFAEFAETLGVKTDQILTAMIGGSSAAVIYNPDDDSERVVLVGLRRDDDGIYQYASTPQELPDFLDDIRRILEQRMTDQLGEPGEEQ